ncbi:hypothetical protein [Gelatiniphilus marinus]|uniref:Uncharacterized protein n=1 Tax=Gelatiniphilus marinus TaxID=1759464 RepID=A0ABW5JNZ0_9FLAO
MKTLQPYTSFNRTKSIEELQYYILRAKTSLEYLKFELNFFKSLLSKPIYKTKEINLYETLVNYKREIHTLNENNKELLTQLLLHANQIKKMKYKDLPFNNLFIKKHDDLELSIFNFKTKISDFKFRLFQYLESVVIN